ncbi:transcriptional regulator [Streptomyces sp. NPDC091272]|uniref:transcriptional regulator n=1 Tax=Streptomyces sp. NPDC091272 TaxID=3365981 RepID=UPI0037F74A7A
MTVRTCSNREPNQRLRAVMEEAGCSSTGLARRVNLCGAERGLDLRYDKTSVARWLRGQQPRGRAPVIIAEALERKLGRVVTAEEIGMRTEQGAASAIGLRFEAEAADALQQVCALWRSEANFTAASPAGEKLATSVLVQSSRDWLIADPDPAPTGDGPTPVGPGDVAAVRAMAEAFADLDHRFGSGHTRMVTVRYLDGVVAGLLGGAYGEATGRPLLGAAARLTELAGYMAADTGLLGLAQRYYIQALRLAQAADDRRFGGYVLAAGMSQVALTLGNPRETVQLARVAREGAREEGGPAIQILARAAEARGYALMGDPRACDANAEKALQELERSAPGEDPGPGSQVDRGYVAEQLARCNQDLDRPQEAAQWAQEALRCTPPERTRRRVLRLLLLGAVQLRLGSPDDSRTSALHAAELLSTVRSVRCSQELESLRLRLRTPGRHDGASGDPGRYEEAARNPGRHEEASGNPPCPVRPVG